MGIRVFTALIVPATNGPGVNYLPLMRTMLVVLVTLMTPVSAWPADLSDYFGVWTGTIVEGPTTGREHLRYEVRLEFAPGSYTFNYPSLGCSGSLQLLSRRGRHLRFRDKLKQGKSQCSDGGRTELQIIGPNLVAYQWFDANGEFRAEGYLKRKDQIMVMLTF